MRTVKILFTAAVLAYLTGCNSMPAHNDDLAGVCAKGIQQLSSVLENATSEQPNTKLHRASLLLSAAQVQQEFAQYPKCVEKIQRAKQYIKLYHEPGHNPRLLSGLLNFTPDLIAGQ